MDEKSLKIRCSELSERMAQESRKEKGKKWRCPVDLKTQIVAYASACREQGEALGPISARLGLVESTLARWLRKRKSRAKVDPVFEPGFQSVAIVPSEVEEHPSCIRHLRLTTPDGYIVEGLSLEGVAYLLRAVR